MGKKNRMEKHNEEKQDALTDTKQEKKEKKEKKDKNANVEQTPLTNTTSEQSTNKNDKKKKRARDEKTSEDKTNSVANVGTNNAEAEVQSETKSKKSKTKERNDESKTKPTSEESDANQQQESETYTNPLDNAIDDVESFESFGLDKRILRAIQKNEFKHPTLVQSACIPLALEGKDILARARTGSGKTAAYTIPILQRILREKEVKDVPAISTVIIVPTIELCHQVKDQISQLARYCSTAIDIYVENSENAKTLAESPDILVVTPNLLVHYLKRGEVNIRETLKTLVIDEADLILSLGFERDIKFIADHLPKIYHAFLMSATLTEGVESLKKVILHNPAVIRLDDSASGKKEGKLTQYYIKLSLRHEEKATYLYTLLKFKLKGEKIILFVNTIKECYRFKIFLELIGINAAVLNSELPVNSRYRIIETFNSGAVNALIATDESFGKDKNAEKPGEDEVEKDTQYGVARGTDFKDVGCVINLDLPRDPKSYTHRVGRAARGGADGIAITFYNFTQQEQFDAILKDQKKRGNNISVYPLNKEDVESFEYRVDSIWDKCNDDQVKKLRQDELKQELINSKQLLFHWQAKAKDLNMLKRTSGGVNKKAKSEVASIVADIPEYLQLTKETTTKDSLLAGSALEKKRAKKEEARKKQKERKAKAMQSRKVDPLKSVKVKRK